MSFFGKIFGKEESVEPKKETREEKIKKKTGGKKDISKSKVKKKSDKIVKKKSKKKDRKKHAEKKTEKPGKRKMSKGRKIKSKLSHEKRAEDILFNSQNEIERYYRDQRKRAKELLKEIERKKAESLVNVLQKHLNQVVTERNNLKVIYKDLKKHHNKIFEKIKETNMQKKNNIENIGLVKDLKKNMLKLDEEASSIIDLRKKLIDKEKRIVNKMKKAVISNSDKLKKSDALSSNRLIEVEAKKERLITETNNLLSQERSNLAVDDGVLETIGRSAQKKIIKLNKKLKNLKKENFETLKKVQLLDISREKAREKIKDSIKQIELLKRKYAKVLGIKNKK